MLLVTSSISYSQDVSEIFKADTIYFYGYDFAHFTFAENVVVDAPGRYIFPWINYINSHFPFSEMEKWMKTTIIHDFSFTNKINKEIVDNGVNGFVCSNHKEWKEKPPEKSTAYKRALSKAENAEEKYTNEDMKELILSDFKTNKDRCEKWSGGVYWNSSVSLDDFCDVIMHLLFLGITKASKDLLFTCINERMSGKSLTKCQKIC